MNEYSIFDIECDGLIEDATKIHCLCYSQFKDGIRTNVATTDYNVMKEFFLNEKIVIGHKIITYDIPMIEKFLGIKYEGRQIDTLGLSWYLYPNRNVHGLEGWGEVFGISKPVVVDWKNEKSEVYIKRCIEDVKINIALWNYQLEYLKKIYNSSNAVDRIIGYISFKLECAREQEEEKIKVDVDVCKKNLEELKNIVEQKTSTLIPIMPKITKYKIKQMPKKMINKDTTYSKLAIGWFELLKEHGLSSNHMGAIKIVDKVIDGNPRSYQQIKDWLYLLGWKPITFKHVKEDDGSSRKVPQLSSDDNTGLCQSVKDLFDIEPKLEEFEDLFVANHRIGILEGFLETMDENGFVKAEISGLTNTLRFQHRKPIANLPTIPKKYWEMVRECLIASNDNHILCGSDMASLEDSTKRHYMYYYDPKYVEEMSRDGFDNHLDIAVRANLLGNKEVEFYKQYEKDKEELKKLFNPTEKRREEYSRIKAIRLKAKKTNFAAIYGAGGSKIAVTANVSTKEGYLFHKVYWERNWAVKKIEENTIWKRVNGQAWLYNPVSQFWYSLRAVKDKFSTLNQGTGVYAFDMWVKYCRQQGYKICMQYHDEHVSNRLKGDEENTRVILNNAIDKVNETLKLNIKLGISIDFGDNYSLIH